MKRTHYSHELNNGLDGKEVIVAGWANDIRKMGGIAFLTLRDKKGLVQITLPKAKVGELFDALDNISKESVVAVKGIVQKSDKANLGVEVIPTEINVLSKAFTPLPMEVGGEVQSELETRLNSRFMDLRDPKTNAIFTVKDIITTSLRAFLEGNEFTEIQTPKINAAGAEGGASTFQIDYFGKKAFLAQSPQLFKQAMMASGMDRVYEIAPAFRAEKSHTTRHISEFTSVDYEMSFIDSQEDVMDVLEEMVRNSINQVRGSDALNILGIELPEPEKKFPRITFNEACDLLDLKGVHDLDSEQEKKLGEIMLEKGHELFFLKEFPNEGKPFYIMEKDAEHSFSFDLEYKGQELASGGQREHRYDELTTRMKRLGLNPSDFNSYLSAFKYGMPPHGGMGFGLDRFVQKMLGLENIREAVLFPRDTERLEP